MSPEPPSGEAGETGETPLPASAIDPVCGMTVAPAVARARGLSSRVGERTYYFCGRGCKLDFEDDPDHYLAPGYVPTM
ncbi:MAG TPA: YHS domain-containing protein [Candidatus Limnocylindrales bacterium]|nr:YHS domain-containing protein [Candidatus Limnocylindrales bacterium]